MKAIGKYIVINPTKENNKKTSGGLILTDKQREDIRYRQADIISLGPDVQNISDNNTIYYDRHAGTKIEIKEKQYIVIKEQDVVVVL